MIPTAALPHFVTVADFLGDSFEGESFGSPSVQLPARVEGKRRRVTAADGSDVLGDAVITLRPRSVPVGSKVTHGTNTYRVLAASDAVELRRAHSTELIVAGPA